MKLIHDIQPTKNTWDRGYAHLEYLRGGLARTFSTRIPVWTQCMRCKTVMTQTRECPVCDELSSMDEDAIQQGDYEV